MTDRRLPPLYPLRAFEAAARRLSFTLAAEELLITQSAVSHQVKTLETYFGTQLFYRSTGPVRLTAEGKRLFAACETAFAYLAQISNDLPDRELRSTITIISPPLIFNYWLIARLKSFAERYSGISFRFLSMACGARIFPGDADVALLWHGGLAEGFVGAKLFDMQHSPMASPRLAATLPDRFDRQVLERTVLLHENDHSGWSAWLREAGHDQATATTGWVFEDPGMMIEAAAAGHGIALGPFPLLDELVNSGRVVKVFGRPVTTQNTYFFAISERSLRKPGIALFWNWFTQHGLPPFSDLLSGGAGGRT